MNFNKREEQFMNIGTAANAVFHMRQVEEKELKREKIASWYITVPGIPAQEKEKLEKSLKYDVWSSLIRFVVLYFVFSCIWIFGVGRYDPFESVTGYRLMGKRTVTAVVQEDGMTASLKDPNEGEHSIYNLTDLGIDPTGYTYGDRLNTYWSRDGESNVYCLLTVLPEKKASHIEYIYGAFMITGYLGIIVVGLAIFFIRRRIYTGWFPPFYYRMEKFCSDYKVYQRYLDCDTVDAFISYGNENPYEFARQFAATHLTIEERKQKRRTMAITVGISILIVAAIILAITLIVSVQTAVDNKKNEARTVKVLEELQSAIDGEVEPLGDQSEYYNFADMVNRAKESFPGETVYYKLVTTDEYVSLIITTEKKKNVYFDRYMPVDGNVGDEDVVYKLEISMVSDAMQPDDILHNYTGILK
ncbi:hypothetical protein DW058_10490 [Clostridiaceae bacterium AF42-6]|nr:hypothetical protein DW058_10490 [Clostridiaceae bacterium AF42-6]